MNFLIIFNQSIIPILVIVSISFLFNRIYKPNLIHLTNLALIVFTPIFVFSSLIKHNIDIYNLWQPVLFMIILTSLLILISLTAAFFLKLEKNKMTSLVLACSMINVGNFGLPLIYFTYGQQAVSYSVIYFIVFNIPLTTLAIYLSSDKTRFWDITKDFLKIPIFHAFLVALLFTYFQIELPQSVATGLDLIAQGAIPLLIVVLGIQISNISFKKNFADFIWIILAGLCIRLVISPILAHNVLNFFSLSALESSVATVQTSGPSAILPLIYVIKFNKSPELLAALIVFTTIFSGISLPLVISFL